MSLVLPIIKLKFGHDRKINSGHPWIYSNEIENNNALLDIKAGTLVKIGFKKIISQLISKVIEFSKAIKN